MKIVLPRAVDRVQLYDGKEPLFHKYGVEEEIARIQRRHVPLKGGGSIVIDQTEALVAIDVNSGSFRQEVENIFSPDGLLAGASNYEVSRAFDERTVDLSGSPMFVEGILTLTGSGRPDLDS
jgi:hypothetical protein